MSALSNLLIPAVLFFALGFIARAIKSDLRVPPDLAKVLSIYLLMAIGLHGGYALGKADLAMAFNSVLWAIILGFALPLIGYALLLMTRKVDHMNSAAIAAHYGSVSAGTFLTAIAYLDNLNIGYESYPVIMLAVMESPAIIVGLLLASWSRQRLAVSANGGGTAIIQRGGMGNGQLGGLLHEAFTNGSVIILIGSMFIGAVASPASMEKLSPFVDDIFMGVLCLFLFEMGMEAARRIREFRKVGPVLLVFGIVMPLIGGAIGLLVGGLVLDMSVGGTLLVGVLGASASYIAVPPAMRLAVPEANPSFYLTLSLGITFPFNVIIGIPLYHALAERIVG
ncbi:MAG: sodium-dependent bicarbonate transport family permease [Thiohalophilus sp.]|uniref:sodium-dependent bicarbonate transport family permease n=1 Tax=Thiohalophilus sp. TaxID=3028392 RepID=UPI00286FE987|nr:sodium-dependent bicarbonate transport family permease [Thiohalophilus sp.]MDR9437455.1 sodium-dependent bicarbonate transport family permease [Thiohalophilus sp.]